MAQHRFPAAVHMVYTDRCIPDLNHKAGRHRLPNPHPLHSVVSLSATCKLNWHCRRWSLPGPLRQLISLDGVCMCSVDSQLQLFLIVFYSNVFTMCCCDSFLCVFLLFFFFMLSVGRFIRFGLSATPIHSCFVLKLSSRTPPPSPPSAPIASVSYRDDWLRMSFSFLFLWSIQYYTQTVVCAVVV